MNFREAVLIFAFFTFITLIFFYKIFLGLIPLPTDLIVGAYYPWLNYKWGNYIISVPVQNPKLSDAVSLYYPFKALATDYIKSGQLPLWNPHMFGGYPLLANVQAGLLFPTMIFYLLFSQPLAWTLQVISQPLLASFFMYLLLRHFKLEKLPSIFGSIVYGFGGSTILWIQWNTQATTSLFLPILILLEDKYLISKSLKWGVLFSIFICLQILAGYLPVIPFTFVGMSVWYLFRSSKSLSDLKIFFFIILGFLLSAIFLLPVAELIQASQRTIETLGTQNPFISLYNLIYFVAPDFFGNDATGNFWGSGDHMDFTLYAGVTAFIFATIAVKQLFNSKLVRFALALFTITLIIITANPLSTLLYKLGVWGGSSITMNRADFLINFSLAILGACGISLIEKSYSKMSLKPAIWIMSAAIGIITGLLISRHISINSLGADQTISHINISLRNLVLPAFFIGVVLLLLLLTKKVKLLRSFVVYIFIFILILELFRFGWKFNAFSPSSFAYPETPISGFLEKYPNDRFIAEPDIFPANMWLPFKISSIEGYDGVYPIKSAQLLAIIDSGNANAAPKGRWGILQNFNSNVLNATNTRFIVAVKRGEEGRSSEKGEVVSTLRIPEHKEIFSDKGVAILENTQSLPRVYLTKNVINASDSATLKYLLDSNFPIENTSISDFDWSNNSNEALKNDLTYRQVTNSHVLIKSTSNIDAYLVVLDSFYPGWKAFIDGKETQIHRTNYNFKGIILPKGIHTVEFKYFPNSLKYGAIISIISLAIIFLLLLIHYLNEGNKK